MKSWWNSRTASNFVPQTSRADEPSDLAVLRIKADHRLPTATLGDSDKLEIGEWVLAIGHPFDRDLTVSAGIISGKAHVLALRPAGRSSANRCVDQPGQLGRPAGKPRRRGRGHQHGDCLRGTRWGTQWGQWGTQYPGSGSRRLSRCRLCHPGQSGQVGRQTTCREGVSPAGLSRCPDRRDTCRAGRGTADRPGQGRSDCRSLPRLPRRQGRAPQERPDSQVRRPRGPKSATIAGPRRADGIGHVADCPDRSRRQAADRQGCRQPTSEKPWTGRHDLAGPETRSRLNGQRGWGSRSRT